MSIRTSLSRWLALQTLVGLSLVCAGVYVSTLWSFQLRQDEEFMRHLGVVEHVTREVSRPFDRPALRHKLDDYFHAHSDAAISLSSGTEILYATDVQPEGTAWQSRTTTFSEIQLDGKPLELRLSLNIERDRLLLWRLAWTLVGAAAIGTLLVSLTAAERVRRGLQPLQRLAEETAAAGPDQPGRRIEPTTYAEELRPWIVQFNALLARVEGAYSQLEAFNADVAHELRTPLSNMIAQLEVEFAQDRPEAELQYVLESQLEEARRLTTIVTDMLFLSKADRGAQARRGDVQSLAEQVLAVAEFQEASLEDASLRLRVEGDAQLSMDAGLVRRAVSNLVGNAKRYAMPGSVIRVVIVRRDAEVQLAVENLGEPIASEALPRLFERFYRADPSRSGSASHHGLGLAIVAAIARMHGGYTFAESSAGVTRIGLALSDMPRTGGDTLPRIL